MSQQTMKAALQLLVVSASLEQRFGPTLASVHGISLQELLLLMNLERAPLHRLRRVDLAAAMNIGASSISHLGDPLEKEGLVRKEFDARDARVAYISLTEAGSAKILDASATLDELSQRIFDERWSLDDIEGFSRRLSQLLYGTASSVGL